MTTSLHLVASVLLALVMALLAVVASRPALQRWRDLRAWEERLNQRPVDWRRGYVALGSVGASSQMSPGTSAGTSRSFPVSTS